MSTTTLQRKQASVSWQEHAKMITAAWQKGVESIVETGDRLIEAKGELEHGSFEAMVQTKLPFGPDTARMLMAIARHPVISKPEHVRVLPPSWGTLYQLTKLPDPLLTAKIKDGTITPELERKDVPKLLPPPEKKKPKPEAQVDDDDAPGDDDAQPCDDEETNWRRGLLHRANVAIADAQFEDSWSRFHVDRVIEEIVQRAADAWSNLATYLRKRRSATKDKKDAYRKREMREAVKSAEKRLKEEWRHVPREERASGNLNEALSVAR
jgi:hypothetical protein